MHISELILGMDGHPVFRQAEQIPERLSGFVKGRAPSSCRAGTSPPDLLAHTTLLFPPDHAPLFPLSIPFSTSLLRRRLYQWSFSFLAEPHEICDEESLASVVWKETPAGDAAAVRCPRNATGKDDCMPWLGSWPTLRLSFIFCLLLGEENLVVAGQDKQMGFPPFTRS